jgi:hypothetical protein
MGAGNTFLSLDGRAVAGSHSFARVEYRNRTDEPPPREGFDSFARVKCRDGKWARCPWISGARE